MKEKRILIAGERETQEREKKKEKIFAEGNEIVPKEFLQPRISTARRNSFFSLSILPVKPISALVTVAWERRRKFHSDQDLLPYFVSLAVASTAIKVVAPNSTIRLALKLFNSFLIS